MSAVFLSFQLFVNHPIIFFFSQVYYYYFFLLVIVVVVVVVCAFILHLSTRLFSSLLYLSALYYCFLFFCNNRIYDQQSPLSLYTSG